jgi:hypothetical protein
MNEKGLNDPSVRGTFISRFPVRLGNMAPRGQVERIRGGQGVRWRFIKSADDRL